MKQSKNVLNVDSSMFDLFQSELIVNTKEINQILNKNNNTNLNEDIDTILISFQSIEGASRIIGFKPVEEICVKISSLLINARDKGIKVELSEKFNWALLESNNILIGISNKNINEINDDMNSFSKKISEQLIKIDEILDLFITIKDKVKNEDSISSQRQLTQEYTDISMIDLFQIEVENNCRILEENLIEAEGNNSREFIEPLMRAAHSIKGAARIVGLDIAVNLAHNMEEILEKAMNGELILESSSIDELLKSTDVFKQLIGMSSELVPNWFMDQEEEINMICMDLKNISRGIISRSKKK